MNVIDNLRHLAESEPDIAELLLANPAVPDEHIKELLSTATQNDSALLIALASHTGLSPTRFRQLVDVVEALTESRNSGDAEDSPLTVLLSEAVSNPALPTDLLARGGQSLTWKRARRAGDVLSHQNLPREIYLVMVDAVLAGRFPEDRTQLETFFSSKNVLDYYSAHPDRIYLLASSVAKSPHFPSLPEAIQVKILTPREINLRAGNRDRAMHAFPPPPSATAESLRAIYKQLLGTQDATLENLLVNVVAHRNFPIDALRLEELDVRVENGVLHYSSIDIDLLAALRSTDPAVLKLLEAIVRTDGKEEFYFHDVAFRILSRTYPREESLLNAVLDRIEERGDRFIHTDLLLLDRIVSNPATTPKTLARAAVLIPDSDLDSWMDSWTTRSILLHPLVSHSTRLQILDRLSQGTDDQLKYREDLVRYITTGEVPLHRESSWEIYHLERNQLNAQFWSDHQPGPMVHNEASTELARTWLHNILERRSDLVVNGVMCSQEIEPLLIDLTRDLLTPDHGTEADWLNLALMFGVVGSTARRADGSKNS